MATKRVLIEEKEESWVESDSWDEETKEDYGKK